MYVLSHPAVTAFLGLLVGVALMLCYRSYRRFELDQETTRSVVALRNMIEELAGTLEKETNARQAAEQLAANESRRRVETVEMIAVIERDRDRWREMYWKCGIGHSAAQQVMIQRITLLHSILTRHEIQIPRGKEGYEQAVDDFRKEHVSGIPDNFSTAITTGGAVAKSHADSVESAPKC